MVNKLTFLAGAAVGYLIGVRTDRSRYEEMKRRADALWHDPRVQEKVSAAGQTVKEKAPGVGAKIAGAAGQATSAVKHKVTSNGEAGSADQLIGSESGSDYTPHETKFQS